MDILETLKKNKWIVLIFIIALIVRIVFVYAMPVKLWDETVYLNLGHDLSENPADYSFANHGWSDFIPGGMYPKAGFRAPLLPYLLSMFYLLHLNFLVNFFLPLIGALSVVLVYILGKDLFNEKVGLVSATVLAFVPLHAFYSARVLTDSLLTFFLLLTFISFWKGFEKENKKYIVLFGLFFALSVLSRYTALWAAPVFVLYVLLRRNLKQIWCNSSFWKGMALMLIVLSPWLIYSFIEYGNPIGALMHGMQASSYWGGIQSWNFFFNNWWNIFSVAGFLSVIGIVYFIFSKEFFKKEILLLFAWILLFLGVALLFPHKEERFILPIAPAISILTGAFIIKQRKYWKIWFLLTIILMIFSTATMFQNEYSTYHNTNTLCFQKVLDHLNTISGNFVIVSENPTLFRYYVGQENQYYPDLLSKNSIKDLEKSENMPVYFVFTKFNSGFEKEKLEELRSVMNTEYTLRFECVEDPDNNFIYSNSLK